MPAGQNWKSLRYLARVTYQLEAAAKTRSQPPLPVPLPPRLPFATFH
jgi:hypothetical protein